MLIREITKIAPTGGHIEIMLNIKIAKLELTGGHIGIMLIVEIGIMLIIETTKIK